jgi:hypothetical protein
MDPLNHSPEEEDEAEDVVEEEEEQQEEEEEEEAEDVVEEEQQEEEEEVVEETEWDSVYDKWRRGTRLYLQTYGGGPSGGYIIDYTTRPGAVFRWRRPRPGADEVITPLPDGIRLLYTDFPLYTPSDHVREFNVEELESIDFEANNIMYAAVFYEDIWEDAPGESPAASPAASPTATPNAPSDVGIRVAPNPATGSPTVTEERRFNTNCPICHEDFAVGQEAVHYR